MLCPPDIIEKNVDVLVIGGGLPGVCAAIEAAMGGAKVALVEREQTLGGNCGPQLGVHPSDGHRFHPYMPATGIVGRLIEDAAFVQAKTDTQWYHYNVSHRWDNIMSQALKKAGVEVLRRHYAHTPEVENGRITAVWCEALNTYQRVRISVNTAVIDDSGDGNISERAGAEYRMGRDAKSTYGERLAPEEAEATTMGASLVMIAYKTDHEVKFIPPEGTPPYHDGYAENVTFCPKEDESLCFLFPCETGGDIDIINDYDVIYERLVGMCYAVWNRIKNEVSVEESKNWDILWVSPIAGKRESRRFLGDYVLTQTDCESGRIFEDAIAVGGFAVDIHYPRKEAREYVKVVYHGMPPTYSIPYRCIYSKDIENLFFASRLLSVSHLAHGSVRLQRTLATIGQAAGAAAAMCKCKNLTAREIYTQGHIKQLQQLLLTHDATIPGVVKDDPADLAPKARAWASSERAQVFDFQAPYTWQPLTENSGVELWNFADRLDTVSFLLKNCGDQPQTLTAKIYRFTPPRKYQLREERSFFPYFEHHNEAEWGNEYRLEQFTLLKEVQSCLPPQTETMLAFKAELALSERDIFNDDDRVAVVLSGAEQCALAVQDRAVEFEKWITGVQDRRFTVVPQAPVCALAPQPLLGEACLAVGGHNRRYATNPRNMWQPQMLPATLTLTWDEAHPIYTVALTLDTLTRTAHEMPFECHKRASEQLAKSIRVEGMYRGKTVKTAAVGENHNRLCLFDLEGSVCDSVRLTLEETWKPGEIPGVYDIRVYDSVDKGRYFWYD